MKIHQKKSVGVIKHTQKALRCSQSGQDTIETSSNVFFRCLAPPVPHHPSPKLFPVHTRSPEACNENPSLIIRLLNQTHWSTFSSKFLLEKVVVMSNSLPIELSEISIQNKHKRIIIKCHTHVDRNEVLKCAFTSKIFQKHGMSLPHVPQYELNLSSVIIANTSKHITVKSVFESLPPSVTYVPKSTDYVCSGDVLLLRSPQEAASWDGSTLCEMTKHKHHKNIPLRFRVSLYKCPNCNILEPPLSCKNDKLQCMFCEKKCGLSSEQNNFVSHSTCSSCAFSHLNLATPHSCQNDSKCITRTKLTKFFRRSSLHQIRFGCDEDVELDCDVVCTSSLAARINGVRCPEEKVHQQTKRCKLSNDVLKSSPSTHFKFASWNMQGSGNKYHLINDILNLNKIHVLCLQDLIHDKLVNVQNFKKFTTKTHTVPNMVKNIKHDVGMYIHKRFAPVHVPHMSDVNGSFICVKIHLPLFAIHIFSVYNRPRQNTAIINLTEMMTKNDEHIAHFAMCGDFNAHHSSLKIHKKHIELKMHDVEGKHNHANDDSDTDDPCSDDDDVSVDVNVGGDAKVCVGNDDPPEECKSGSPSRVKNNKAGDAMKNLLGCLGLRLSNLSLPAHEKGNTLSHIIVSSNLHDNLKFEVCSRCMSDHNLIALTPLNDMHVVPNVTRESVRLKFHNINQNDPAQLSSIDSMRAVM